MKKIILTALVLTGITATAQVKVGSNPTTLATDANFQVEATDGTQFFINKTNGNVGIGTTTPTERFVVSNNVNNKLQAVITNPSSSANAFAELKVNSGTTDTYIGSTNANAAFGAVWDGRGYILNNTHNYGLNIMAGGNNSNLQFYTGGSNASNERMRITSTGNVGIGTTTPAEKLHVAGSIQMVDGNQGVGKLMVSDANGKATWTDLATSLGTFASKWGYAPGTTDVLIAKKSDGSNRSATGETFYIDDNGFVGIGTFNQQSRLSVQGTSTGTTDSDVTISLINATAGTAASPNRTFFNFVGYNNKVRGSISGLDEAGNFDRGTLTFGTQDNGGSVTEKMRIMHNGNVGIGTTTPSAKLEVNGTAYSGAHTSTNNFVLNSAGSKLGTLASPSANTFSLGYTGAVNTLGTSVLTWNNSGNVGIGTTTPSFRLQVENSVNAADGIFTRNTNTGSSASSFVSVNSSVGQLLLRAHSATHPIWPNTTVISSDAAFTGGLAISQSGTNPISFLTNGTERARLNGSGNLGVGTTSPATRLDVNGYIKVGSADATGDATPVAGMIRYNSTTNKFQGYVGAPTNAWVDF